MQVLLKPVARIYTVCNSDGVQIEEGEYRELVTGLEPVKMIDLNLATLLTGVKEQVQSKAPVSKSPKSERLEYRKNPKDGRKFEVSRDLAMAVKKDKGVLSHVKIAKKYNIPMNVVVKIMKDAMPVFFDFDDMAGTSPIVASLQNQENCTLPLKPLKTNTDDRSQVKDEHREWVRRCFSAGHTRKEISKSFGFSTAFVYSATCDLQKKHDKARLLSAADKQPVQTFHTLPPVPQEQVPVQDPEGVTVQA